MKTIKNWAYFRNPTLSLLRVLINILTIVGFAFLILFVAANVNKMFMIYNSYVPIVLIFFSVMIWFFKAITINWAWFIPMRRNEY
jgi:hypothetical protein